MQMNYLIAILVILGVFAAWIGVQHLARAFAKKHPELCPDRGESGGCGFFCLCKHRDQCKRREEAEDSESSRRN